MQDTGITFSQVIWADSFLVLSMEEHKDLVEMWFSVGRHSLRIQQKLFLWYNVSKERTNTNIHTFFRCCVNNHKKRICFPSYVLFVFVHSRPGYFSHCRTMKLIKWLSRLLAHSNLFIAWMVLTLCPWTMVASTMRFPICPAWTIYSKRHDFYFCFKCVPNKLQWAGRYRYKHKLFLWN
jgi:hypothetical protein